MRRGNAGQRWTFHTGGGLHADCHIIETVYGACPSATLEFTPSSIAVRSEERIRRVRSTMPGRFIGTIESASGHTLMAVFNNNDEQGDVAYAVGGSGVVGWLAEVYGFDYSTVRVRGLES